MLSFSTPKQKRSQLVVYLLRHALIGFGLGMAFVVILLALDTGGLATLVQGAPGGWFAASLFALVMGLTFGSLQMGFAVMLLADRDCVPAGPGLAALVNQKARR